MTPSTPLPEQGGFNEKLNMLFSAYKVHNKNIDACFNDAVAEHHIKQSIRTLVLEELERTMPPSQEIPWLSDYEDEELGEQHQAEAEAYNSLRSDFSENLKRTILGGTHGTK